MRVGIDIETNTDHDKIWECILVEQDTGDVLVCETPEQLFYAASQYEEVTWVSWNGLGFDLPILKKLWGVDLSGDKHIDGMVLSQLFDPVRATGHSLASYGRELGRGDEKIDFTDYNFPAEGESVPAWNKRRQTYCIQDVYLTLKATALVESRLDKEHFNGFSRELEHTVASILAEQRSNGFKLDIGLATSLCQKWLQRLSELEREMQQMFPVIIYPRFSEKTGKRLKDGVEEFNPGSRVQIAKRLELEGVKFTKFTEKGNPIVDESTLADIDHPAAQLVMEYLLLQKREGQVRSWLECVHEDGRVHGRVVGNGAITGRMTHSNPNMAQVPGVNAPWGEECRRCWIVDEGNKLVGTDASGLELRVLAHYMKDEDFIKEVEEGDVHTRNQQAAGLPTRDEAKTFIYAFIYGAGNAKLGAIAGGTAKTGTNLRAKFLAQTPALKQLIDLTQKIARTSKSVPGLDGRRIRVRKEHAALNTLLQGNGAIVLKVALVRYSELLQHHKVPHRFVANVHDEWQVETPATYAETVGKLGVKAIEDAGEMLNLRCKLTGEYNIGNNWAETH